MPQHLKSNRALQRVPPTPSTMPSWTLEGLARHAKLLGNLGTVHRTITANQGRPGVLHQGLGLMYGFNHDEAARSFAKAAELDPSCGVCFWGLAYVLGPNYNVPMLPDRSPAAWDALRRHSSTPRRAQPVEQALIGALAKRYPGPESVDPMAMKPFNQAYADAMKAVAKRSSRTTMTSRRCTPRR